VPQVVLNHWHLPSQRLDDFTQFAAPCERAGGGVQRGGVCHDTSSSRSHGHHSPIGRQNGQPASPPARHSPLCHVRARGDGRRRARTSFGLPPIGWQLLRSVPPGARSPPAGLVQKSLLVSLDGSHCTGVPRGEQKSACCTHAHRTDRVGSERQGIDVSGPHRCLLLVRVRVSRVTLSRNELGAFLMPGSEPHGSLVLVGWPALSAMLKHTPRALSASQ
jgi:hypothetical protein